MIHGTSIGYPWIFRGDQALFQVQESCCRPPTVHERVEAAMEHLRRSLEWKGEKLGVLEMRRHYTNYFRGYPGIKEFRNRLVSGRRPGCPL